MDAKSLFTLRKPCPDCPFLKENRDMLRPGRLEDIIINLHANTPFHCHKTINYKKRSKVQQIAEAKYCAGSMIYLEKADNTNVPMRLGLMFGIYDPSKLSGHDQVIEPLGLDRYIPGRKNATNQEDA
ncbi:hypothetical protein [Paenibacillus taichungensis]